MEEVVGDQSPKSSRVRHSQGRRRGFLELSRPSLPISSPPTFWVIITPSAPRPEPLMSPTSVSRVWMGLPDPTTPVRPYLGTLRGFTSPLSMRYFIDTEGDSVLPFPFLSDGLQGSDPPPYGGVGHSPTPPLFPQVLDSTSF